MDEALTDKRLVTGTTSLSNFLKELGYEMKFQWGYGLSKKKLFFFEGKYVISGYQGLALFYMVEGKYKVIHQGLTVHDELLKFFTKRNYDHDSSYNENLPSLLRNSKSTGIGKS